MYVNVCMYRYIYIYILYIYIHISPIELGANQCNGENENNDWIWKSLRLSYAHNNVQLSISLIVLRRQAYRPRSLVSSPISTMCVQAVCDERGIGFTSYNHILYECIISILFSHHKHESQPYSQIFFFHLSIRRLSP